MSSEGDLRSTIMNNTPYQVQYLKYPCIIYETYNDALNGVWAGDVAEGFADGIYYSHAELEILYITHGSAVIEVANTTYSLKQGDLLILNPFETHHLIYTSQNTCYGHQRIKFRASMLLEGADRAIADTIQNLESGRMKFRNLFSIGDEHYSSLLSACQEVFNATCFHINGWEFGLKSGAYRFFYLLISNGYVSECGSNTSVRFTDNIITYIKEHFSEDISASDAAAALGYNKSYFCRLFRETLHLSFTHYLHLTRINYARRKMAVGETNISKIATESGYNSLSYFSKQFRRYIGITPTQFCEKISQSNFKWD